MKTIFVIVSLVSLPLTVPATDGSTSHRGESKIDKRFAARNYTDPKVQVAASDVVVFKLARQSSKNRGPAVKTSPPVITYSVLAGNLTLSWPSANIGFLLQTQTNSINVGLSTNWVDISNSVLTNRITLPMMRGPYAVFYRLKL